MPPPYPKEQLCLNRCPSSSGRILRNGHYCRKAGRRAWKKPQRKASRDGSIVSVGEASKWPGKDLGLLRFVLSQPGLAGACNSLSPVCDLQLGEDI